MKSIPKILSAVLIMAVVLLVAAACKKSDAAVAEDNLTAEEFTFNTATKELSPAPRVNAELASPAGIISVYCYLLRDNHSDSLIYVANPEENEVNGFTLTIPTENFAEADLSEVRGVKVMVKHLDNSSYEGFIRMHYFNPDLPQLTAFPESITANLDGGPTPISGTLTSEYGINQVEVYDDYQTENTFVLVERFENINGAKEYALNYDYNYRKAAQHIKITVTDIYNQTANKVINMPVDVSLFKPKLLDFPASVSDGTVFTGKITATGGLDRVDIYDDRKGDFELVESIGGLNGTKDYDFSYTYTIRTRSENIKIVAVDQEDVQTELVIPLETNYASIIYRNVFMDAQTAGTATIIFEDGTTRGNCFLNDSESTMAFLFYTTSNGPSFYSPSNTSGVAKNYKCNGEAWTIANAASLKATRFRVLVKGASSGQTDVYNLYENNELDDLSDAFFEGKNISAPSSSGPRYDPSSPASASLFNLTDAYLIYVRIPDGAGHKNAIVRLKEIMPDGGNSTIKFDFHIQK
jgi:hypothetical protein